MINEIIQNTESSMQKSIEILQNELAKLRTGRAHPSIIESVSVESYGNITTLKSVASITASDARTLTVAPWDKGMLKVIEKAIMNADLGLNPQNDGQVLRIPLPPLTEQRRKDLVKVVKTTLEQARVSIRNMRRDANDKLKALLKQKTISEDEERKAQDKIQKITDKFIAKAEEISAIKEKDLLTI